MPAAKDFKTMTKELKAWISQKPDEPRHFALINGDKPMLQIGRTSQKGTDGVTQWGTATFSGEAIFLNLDKGRVQEKDRKLLEKTCAKAIMLPVKVVLSAGEDGNDDDMLDALSVEEEKQAEEVAAFQAGLDQQAAAAAPPQQPQALPPVPGGAPRIIWKDDLTKRVREIHNNPDVQMGPTPVELAVPEDVLKELRGLGAEAQAQKMIELAQKLAEAAAQRVAKAHRNARNYEDYKSKFDPVPDDFDERFVQRVVTDPTMTAVDRLRSDLQQVPGVVLKAAKLPNIPPGWFKTQATVKVAAPAIGLVAGAAATVVGSVLAQPEVAVPAAYATARSAASGYQAVTGLWKDTLKTKETLDKTITNLEARYREALAARGDDNDDDGSTRTSTNLSEVGYAALNAAAGKEMADTIPKVRGLLDDLEGKLARARKTYGDATQEVHNILKYVDQGVLELKGDLAKKLETNLKVAEKTAPKISGVEGYIQPLRIAVEALEAEMSKGAHNAAVVLPLIVDLGLVVGNMGVSGAGLSASFEATTVFSSRAAEWVNASVNSSVDIAGAAMSAKEARAGKR